MGLMVTAGQVGLMFAMMLLGLFAAKKRWVSDEATVGMTNILVYFVTPCVIIVAFHRPFSMDQLYDLGIVALIDFALLGALIALTHIAFRRVSDPDRRRALRFGGVYSNAGFLGLPLAQALLGQDGVFFAAIFVVAFNVYVWTHGRSMFPGSSTNPFKKLVATPAIPAVILGIILFLTSAQLPDLLMTGLGYLANLNTPLSMLVVGANMAVVNWRTFLRDQWTWIGVGVRNFLVPLVTVLILWAIPLPTTTRLAILIPASCPIAAFLVMFSVMYKTDTEFPTKLVCLSTLVSVITLPGVLWLAGALW